MLPEHAVFTVLLLAGVFFVVLGKGLQDGLRHSPGIGVVVALRNAECWVESMLRDLSAASVSRNYELVVLDLGSRDRTCLIARKILGAPLSIQLAGPANLHELALVARGLMPSQPICILDLQGIPDLRAARRAVSQQAPGLL